MFVHLAPRPLCEVMRECMNCKFVTSLECTSCLEQEVNVKFENYESHKFGLFAVAFQVDSSGLAAIWRVL